ncbi:hypothetical protein BGZ72_003527 [Mortierella alpina]|nr:hypothetical protein BGZ72_003527 [Mortierella alpina]
MAHVSPHDSHSTSTPPPSPPLTASGRRHAPKQSPATARPNSAPQTDIQPIHSADSTSGRRRSHERRSRHSTSESSPRGAPDAASFAATAAAAAAAAASYTSHELAIAYSMVTSDSQQEEQQDGPEVNAGAQEEQQRRRRQLELSAKHQDPAAETAAAAASAYAPRPEHSHARYPSESHDYRRLREHQKPYQDEQVDSLQGSAESPPHAGYARQDGGEYRTDARGQQPGQEGGQQGYGSNVQSGPGGRSDSGRNGAHHPRIRSAPHSFPSQQQPHPQQHASVSHHPNALNRYPFSIPSISAKLDQPHPEDGSDALSTLWKKTAPLQEPYFRTRHTIASQHTLSTLGGVLFSLDEVPTEFNQDMYIAMRNRIFELEAKAVNYSPFSHSRKRSIDRSDLDEYPVRYGYGTDNPHYSKRASHGDSSRSSRGHGHPFDDQHPSPVHRPSSSYPSWYTPEVYTNASRYPPQQSRHDVEYNSGSRSSRPPQYELDSNPSSRPASPQPAGHHQQVLPPMRTGHTPPPSGAQGRLNPQPHSYHPPTHTLDPHQPQVRHEEHPPHPNSPSGHYAVGEHAQPHPAPNHARAQAGHGPPPHLPQQPPHPQPSPHHLPHAHAHHSQQPQQPEGAQGYPPLHHRRQPHPQPAHGPAAGTQSHTSPMNTAGSEQPMSVHQQRHRAQQQAQSAHSRSYHLHKHMRMIDQQRAAQLAAQQQHEKQKQAQQQKQQQQQQPGGQAFKPIQRHYQPHQQMYPVHNQPIAIKPHPQPPQSQQAHQQQRQQQALRPNPFQPQQRTMQQQQQQQQQQHQLLQRYHQQRQLQQKQHQLRQLQLLRSRSSAAPYPTQKNSHYAVAASPGSHSPTPPRVFGPQVDRPIKKSTRPLECSNCMALDSVTWKPKVDGVSAEGHSSSGSTASAGDEDASARSKILCPTCTVYLQTHGKPRPVGPFRANFLKKIHTRFKRELQEVRFQGWQDAQVLEIEDRMSEREFQMVFNGLDESDASQITSGQVSACGSPAPSPGSASESAPTAAGMAVAASGAASDATVQGAKESGDAASSTEEAKRNDSIVIKIEDDDDDAQALARKIAKPENIEVRTFQSEASVGELFGHRWRTEPVVGYTLVHFGGSDRTRMVPMNPTVPSLTITFNRSEQSITFAFRVLVNGLCLLSSGGGPPALHMPEMADEDESEEEGDEVVVVPDNDKEDQPSPSPPPPMGPTTTDSGAGESATSSLALTAAPSKGGEVAHASEAVDTEGRASGETPAASTVHNDADLDT